MKSLCVRIIRRGLIVLLVIPINGADETETPIEKIQGTWISPGTHEEVIGGRRTGREKPREVLVFRGDRWTLSRDAYVSRVYLASHGEESLAGEFRVPRYEAWGTFRLVGTKTPRVIIMSYEHPKGGELETTYELPDGDTLTFYWIRRGGFAYQVGLRRFQREDPAAAEARIP